MWINLLPLVTIYALGLSVALAAPMYSHHSQPSFGGHYCTGCHNDLPSEEGNHCNSCWESALLASGQSSSSSQPPRALGPNESLPLSQPEHVTTSTFSQFPQPPLSLPDAQNPYHQPYIMDAPFPETFLPSSGSPLSFAIPEQQQTPSPWAAMPLHSQPRQTFVPDRKYSRSSRSRKNRTIAQYFFEKYLMTAEQFKGLDLNNSTIKSVAMDELQREFKQLDGRRMDYNKISWVAQQEGIQLPASFELDPN
ncbi:hypothetical protein H0H93_003131 [Arthromyces matolae]|nr:hypothetical protein H0H93_003131 [Arthromyces matolae]